MSQDKRTMIIQEIQYWKKNKLLPEQYCDFLLNLYGSDAEASSSASPLSMERMGSRKGLVFALVVGFIAIISMVVLHFNAFPLPMQIISGCIGVGVLLIAGIVARKRHVPLAYLSLGLGCLLMLWVGEWLLIQYGWDEPVWALGYLSICCALWLIIGINLRLTLLQICGWLGLSFIYGWLLWERLDPLYGIQLQVAWGAIGLLFIWCGWLAKRMNRSMTRAFLVVALLSWIAPEMMTITSVGMETYVPPVMLVSKLFILGIGSLTLRHRWIGWIRDQ